MQNLGELRANSGLALLVGLTVIAITAVVILPGHTVAGAVEARVVLGELHRRG